VLSKSLCVCGVVFAMFAQAPKPPAEPTAEQLEKAKADFKALRGGYAATIDPLTKQTVHGFWIYPASADEKQRKLPNPPFAFAMDISHLKVPDDLLKEIAPSRT